MSVLAALLSTGLLGCSANTAPTSDESDAPAASEYAITCHGEVTQRSAASDLSIRCVDGERGCRDACAAQEIDVRYEPPASRCGSVDLFGWDGATCKAYPTNQGGTMICTGAGCATLFATADECRAAHASCPQ